METDQPEITGDGTCPQCGGSGKVLHFMNSEFPVNITCPDCEGRGYYG